MTTSSTLQVSLASTLSTSPFAPLDPLIPSATGTGIGLENSFYSLSHEIADGDREREPVGQVKSTIQWNPSN